MSLQWRLGSWGPGAKQGSPWHWGNTPDLLNRFRGGSFNSRFTKERKGEKPKRPRLGRTSSGVWSGARTCWKPDRHHRPGRPVGNQVTPGRKQMRTLTGSGTMGTRSAWGRPTRRIKMQGNSFPLPVIRFRLPIARFRSNHSKSLRDIVFRSIEPGLHFPEKR